MRHQTVIAVIVAVVVVLVAHGAKWLMGRRGQPWPPAGVQTSQVQVNKPLSEWSCDDVRQWLVREGFSTEFADSCFDDEIDGEVLVHILEPSASNDNALPEGLSHKDHGRLLKAVKKLVKLHGRPKLGFWGYRKLHRWHAEVVGTALLYHPRSALLYLNFRERDTTLAALHQSSTQLPFIVSSLPTEGLAFGALGLLAPQLLISAHVLPYFDVSYWVMYVFVLMQLSNWLVEIRIIVGAIHEGRALTRISERAWSSVKQICIFFTWWWCVWPIIPWFLCDLCTYSWFLLKIAALASQPMRYVWSKDWISAVAWSLLTAFPLLLDDNIILDAIIHMVVNLVVFMLFASFRIIIGRMTPLQLEETFGPLAGFLVPKPVLRIPTDSMDALLTESMQQLNKIEEGKLAGPKPISIVYLDRSAGSVRQQEGIDAGGLYHDWLNRAAEALAHEKSGLFEVSEVNGVEVLRLRPGVDPDVAKFAGRLLALSLSANVALGWSLSEPLARLLLFRRLPDLLGAAQQSSPRGKWQRVRMAALKTKFAALRWTEAVWLQSVGFSVEAWFLAAVGDSKAKWYFDCLDESKTHEQRRQLLKDLEAVECTDDADVTLENLRLRMAQEAQNIFLVAVKTELDAMWCAFHGVPGVLLYGHEGTLSLDNARPANWRHFASNALGEQILDVHEWKRHTKVNYTEKTSNSKQVVEWFWTFVQGLSDSDRWQLFYWATSLKRLPHGGWASPRMKPMTLHIVGDPDRLPVSHTCAHQIDLPAYPSSTLVTEKLKFAIEVNDFALQ